MRGKGRFRIASFRFGINHSFWLQFPSLSLFENIEIKDKPYNQGSGSTIKLAEKLHFREVLGSFGTKSENFMKMKVDETIS